MKTGLGKVAKTLTDRQIRSTHQSRREGNTVS